MAVAMEMMVPTLGYINRAYANAAGITGGTITVAVSINGGSDIFGGALQIAAGANNANNAGVELNPMERPAVYPGDVITATPSGGTGANIGGAGTIVIGRQG